MTQHIESEIELDALQSFRILKYFRIVQYFKDVLNTSFTLYNR